MALDLSTVEGLDAETIEALSKNESFQGVVSAYVEESTNNRVEVAKSEFKTKMNAMDAKVQEFKLVADAFKDVDPNEISTLKAARDNSSELSATLEKLKESYSAKESELATQTQKIKGLQVEQVVNQSVNEYNTLYPEAFGLNTDAVPLASMLLKQAMKVEDDNSVKVYNSKGEVLVTDKGAGTPVDFIESLRAVHPSMFKQPQGSGAKGSASSKGGDNTLTRSEFEALPVAKKAEVARTHTITD